MFVLDLDENFGITNRIRQLIWKKISIDNSYVKLFFSFSIREFWSVKGRVP